jgi:hypothetical protein
MLPLLAGVVESESSKESTTFPSTTFSNRAVIEMVEFPWAFGPQEKLSTAWSSPPDVQFRSSPLKGKSSGFWASDGEGTAMKSVSVEPPPGPGPSVAVENAPYPVTAPCGNDQVTLTNW